MGKGQNFYLRKKMKYVAAYCLLVLSGKDTVSEADLTKFLKAAGCEVNAENVTSVVKALAGKQLHEVMNAGFGKIASLSSGSGAPVQQASNTGAAPEKKEEKKEEAPEEEEEDMDIGDLFG